MIEDEFEQSLVGEAYRSYFQYMDDLSMFVLNMRASSGLVMTGLNLLHKAANPDLEPPIDLKQHQPILHALVIIGAWSALEAYVADFCIAAMREQPDILNTDLLQDVKVPISDLLATDFDKPARVYRAIESKFARSRGVGRFEGVLKVLRLGGSVADEIKVPVLKAQRVRNVWAHHAGRADPDFLQGDLFPQFELGDKVAISTDDTNLYVIRMLMYGATVTNRWRMQNGLDPLNSPDNSAYVNLANRINMKPPGA